jgi:hypothetical protein
MLRYANVNEQKELPFPNGRGVCPCCGGLLIAKCGKIVTHHWAHESSDDCDPWSEPIGPWHLWWQGLVRQEAVEVVRGSHRADIVGSGGAVVELQHSSISAEDIAAREAFYGNMIWLFDATERFASVTQGHRAFFAVGKTKHLERCTKPVFLDFGSHVLHVEQFSDAVTMVSGFGIPGTREWFAANYLADILLPGNRASEFYMQRGGGSDPWAIKSPVWKLKHETRWMNPTTGGVVSFPKWTDYIKVNYCHWTVGDSANKRYDYDAVIDRHPEIANGWTRDTLRQMMGFFGGAAIILGGLLRVLPLPAVSMPGATTVAATRHILELVDAHIRAGRIPILQDSTKAKLLEKAREFEMQGHGEELEPVAVPAMPVQPSLFK